MDNMELQIHGKVCIDWCYKQDLTVFSMECIESNKF